MKIKNIRLGHACNSSSTHSILILHDGVSVSDMDVDTGEYGWDYWTAASKDAKFQWAMLGFYGQLTSSIGEIAAKSILKNHFDWEPNENVFEYVDHQSYPAIPARNNKLDQFSLDYMNKFIENVVEKDNVVIVGGNDNDDENHILASQAKYVIDYPREQSFPRYKVRQDGDLWTMFQPSTGARLTLQWGDNIDIVSPMLADVKITGWCDVGCTFCYQASTEAGTHASLENINAVAKWLGNNNCFEVALGGGEPTSHPQISNVISAFKKADINVNMTSRNLDWFTDGHTENWAKIYTIRSLSAVAASVESLTAMQRWVKKWPYKFNSDSKNDGPILSFQVIDGLIPPNVLSEMNSLCLENDIRITILGYKTTGFGINVNPPHMGAWVNIFLESDNYYSGISAIDTVIAQQYDLQFLGVDKVSVIDEEGYWSSYFDCTTDEIMVGPSSYQLNEMKVWEIFD